MTAVQPENKPEQKIDQVANTSVQVQAFAEESPSIKSEQNQANWKVFREQRESERKAREESERRAHEKAAEADALRAALEAITNKPSNNRQIHDNGSQDIDESEEQRIDRRVELAIKQREEIAVKQRLQRALEEMPERLNQTFSDFNKVCSSENLDYLEYHYPEVAAPYKHLPESFDKWASIYKAVKRFVPVTDSKQDESKATRNLQKPISISSTGNTQGTGSMPSTKLDESRKAANWERMQRSLKGLSS